MADDRALEEPVIKSCSSWSRREMLLRARVGDEYFLQVFTLAGSVANGGHHSGVGPHSPLTVSDIYNLFYSLVGGAIS